MNNLSSSEHKPVVMVFNTFYLPGFKGGGPIRTLSNMVDKMSDYFEFKIITLDRDLGDTHPYSNILIDDWNNVGAAKVNYVDKKTLSMRSTLNLIRLVRPDIIYLNSFFDRIFTLRILILRLFGKLNGIPILLAPRGEFSIDALKIKKLKKRIFILISRLVKLHSTLSWQASSSDERADIQRTLPFVKAEKIQIAIDFSSTNYKPIYRHQNDLLKRELNSVLRICFLSRIVPNKNLLFAIKCLGQVKVPVEFTIFGPKEDISYWNECEKTIATLPNNIKARYGGILVHEQVGEVLATQDLFFFPTLGENYGHVIHEALMAGLPVLLSDQAPWMDMEVHGVGWCRPLSTAANFVSLIESFAMMPEEQRAKIKKEARAFAQKRAQNPSVLRDNFALFENLLQKGGS